MSLPPGAPPIVAILRGVRPDEVIAVTQVIYDAGIRIIEVPLNSPDPFDSIAKLAAEFGDRCLCGAGTVLTPADVDRVHQAGGELIVTPNSNPEVIARAVALGMVAMPGFATATEGFAALAAGARHLKLFPAATYGHGHLKALKSVLPKGVPLYAVGGVGPAQMADWLAAGADGFGIGGEIYRPGDTPAKVAENAQALMSAYAQATGVETR